MERKIIEIVKNIAAAIEALLNGAGLATPSFVKDFLADLMAKAEAEYPAE